MSPANRSSGERLPCEERSNEATQDVVAGDWVARCARETAPEGFVRPGEARSGAEHLAEGARATVSDHSSATFP